eukprot:CAMPEP_0117484142 /NCGR_PEP_ID=MMETSP0784-20121206/14309_1 /TAXON_ID=39447 /ORGANISM="" /LENGTH=651 /DNA_ID=CAMNT_0005278713 /DNA_START=67 /DNA_END=2022 /DNA_ORIENTATION=-
MTSAILILALAAGIGVEAADSTAPEPHATSFLTAGALDKAAAEEALDSALADALRGDAKVGRLAEIEARLRPMFRALPHDAGGVGHSATRYLLHRFFAKEHRWFTKGLARGGPLAEWVPSYLLELMDRRHSDGRSLNLDELVALVATIEELVHRESIGRLQAEYSLLEVPTPNLVSRSSAEELMDIYTMLLFRGGNLTMHNSQELRTWMLGFSRIQPGWDMLVDWLRGVEESLSAFGEHVSFDETTRVVMAVNNAFGKFNENTACRILKDNLMEIEDVEQPGRVRLSAFYKRALSKEGVWAFNEKKEFLRAFGILDESEPDRPRVILPNYVGSRHQCIEASDLYAVCCPSECEDLLGQLERQIGSPLAAPSEVARIIAKMPSSTVKAPRELSLTLLRRLDDAAAHHGGKVQLHGRLFAQWMNHAFPRECPFPHESGTISPQTPDMWMRETGEESTTASEADMQCIAKLEDDIDVFSQDRRELPWHDTEELVFAPGGAATAASRFDFLNALLRALVLMAVALGLVAASRLALTGNAGITPTPKKPLLASRFGPGWWLATLAFLVAPLVVLSMDYMLDAGGGNGLLACALCFGLAGFIVVGLMGIYGPSDIAKVAYLHKCTGAHVGVWLENMLRVSSCVVGQSQGVFSRTASG